MAVEVSEPCLKMKDKHSSFEILDVRLDRLPDDEGFDETKHVTVNYILNGNECNATPASLNRAILDHPERYPPDVRSMIAKSVHKKVKNILPHCQPSETITIGFGGEDGSSIVTTPDEAPTAVLDPLLVIEANVVEKTVGPQIKISHPDCTEDWDERQELTLKPRTEDKKLVAVRKCRIKIIDFQIDENEELNVIAEIDGETKEWKYNDLEAEVGDNADRYPPIALDILQERKKKWWATHEAREKKTTKDPSPALKLVEMAKQGGKAEFFHDELRIPYARIERAGHYEVKAVKAAEFMEWLTELNYDVEGLAPEEYAAKRARDTLTVLARRGEERPVYLRHGEHDGAFYYDLCNENWQAIRITPEGWAVVDNPPVMFLRHDHMRPQVVPIPSSGDHWALKTLVRMANIGQAGQDVFEVQLQVLMVPDNEQMGGGTIGQEGSGKTSVQRIACAVADPTTDVESSLPKNENSLSLHLATHSLASFDNLTHLTSEQSDHLARSGTGATDTMRELYSNNGINRRKYRTPIFFNGISVTGAKPDFYDRNILYRTHESFEKQTLSKEDFTAKVNELMPYALGEIFDNLSRAMKLRGKVDRYDGWTPRMTGWYKWGLAMAKAMGRPDGWFESIFKSMVMQRDYDAISEHPLTRALEFVAGQSGYVGTASELFAHLNDREMGMPFVCQIDPKDKNWPTSAGSFGMKIKPLMKSLRAHDVFIYKRQWSSLKKYRDVLRGLERARAGINGDTYRDSDDLYIVSSYELDLGWDDEVMNGGK